MKILFVNNQGGGYAEQLEVAEGTTILSFFSTKVPGGTNPDRYTIRVNRNPVQPNYVLQDNDHVTITPAKIAGAN